MSGADHGTGIRRTVGDMTPVEIRDFIRTNHHAVLITRRSNGGLQSSPIVCGIDDGGNVIISVTQDRAKTKNLRRDPRAALCVFTDQFFGPSVQVEGNVTITDLPDALEPLKALYRQVSGEHPDWAEFEQAMVTDRRCIIEIPIA